MKFRWWSLLALVLFTGANQLFAQEDSSPIHRIGFECVHKNPTDDEATNNMVIRRYGLYRLEVEQLNPEPFLKMYGKKLDLYASGKFLVRVYDREKPAETAPLFIAEGEGSRSFFKIDIDAVALDDDRITVEIDLKVRTSDGLSEIEDEIAFEEALKGIEIKSAFIGVYGFASYRHDEGWGDYSSTCTKFNVLE